MTREQRAAAFKELEPYLRSPASERTGYEADGTPTYGRTTGVEFSERG